MIKVLGVGDNVCDKYLDTGVIYPGGNALNVAVFAGMLGAKAAYLGTFGDDEVGRHVYSVARCLGLDLSHCRLEKGDNGCARVQLLDGDRVFLKGNKGGISRLKPPVLTKLDEEYLAEYDLVHTSIHSFMETELPVLRRAGRFVSMDFSDCYDSAYLERCCPYIDSAAISCGSMEEEKVLERIEEILGYGCRHIVIATRGARGALVNVDGKIYRQSPCLVEAKDTMGAGDSFIACFLVHYLRGVDEAVDFGEDSGREGIVTSEAYRELLVRLSLYRAAVFSAAQCEREGSFGYGKTVELTREDWAVREKQEKR